MGLGKMLAKLGNNLKSVIQNIIDPQEMRKLAREVGFVQRCTGRLDGDEFVQTLIIESQDGEKNTLRAAIDTLGKIKPKAKMTIQGIRKRINSQGAVNLIKGIFERSFHIIITQMNRALTKTKNENGLLNFFGNVYLQDSSESQLDEALKDDYMGSGGGNGNGKGEASVKTDLIYEYKNKSFVGLEITDRSQPDTVLGDNIFKVIKKGDLIIRDLGYSVIRVFKQIETLGAFFLSRLHSNLCVYLKDTDTQPLSLGSFLEKRMKKSGYFASIIFAGQRQL